MTVLRATISELMTVDLDHVLFEELGTFDYESLLSMIYDVTSSRKKVEYGQTVGGFPLLGEKDEGASLANRDFKEGYKTAYTHKTYGLYCALSMEAQQDELHGIIDRLPGAMARAIDATINFYSSRIFSRADNATEDFITGGDSVALLSTAHPLKGGGTTSNTPSSGADLTSTSLWSGVIAFYDMLDDESKPVRNAPSILLVPHNSEQKAIELLESNLQSEDANNAVNALRRLKNRSLSYVVWPYWIGSVDPDCWHLLGDKKPWGKNYPLKFYWRMRPETESDNDFFTKEFLYSCVLRFSVGFTDFRFLYGSMGG